MTKTALTTMLATLSKPVIDNHNTTDQVVTLPYFVIIENGTSNFKADNISYTKFERFSVILIQGARDSTLEESVETLFCNNNVPYEITSIDWDEENLLWSIQYEL